MEEFFKAIPDWIKAVITLLSGGAGGFGARKWYQTYLESDQQDHEQEVDLRAELRKDLDRLRERQENYEKELIQTREKYFEMQEKYHELKIKHDEAITENKKLREEIKQLRDEIQQLRENLDK